MLFRRKVTSIKTKFIHGGRKYSLEGQPGLGDHIMTIKPLPNLKGTRTDAWPKDTHQWKLDEPGELELTTSECEAYVEFKVLTETYGRFAGIVVPEQYQRQGVGRAMVLALFSRFPGTVFHNTALNAKSGPFFTALQTEFPTHLAPIAEGQINYWPLPNPTGK